MSFQNESSLKVNNVTVGQVVQRRIDRLNDKGVDMGGLYKNDSSKHSLETLLFLLLGTTESSA